MGPETVIWRPDFTGEVPRRRTRANVRARAGGPGARSPEGPGFSSRVKGGASADLAVAPPPPRRPPWGRRAPPQTNCSRGRARGRARQDGRQGQEALGKRVEARRAEGRRRRGKPTAPTGRLGDSVARTHRTSHAGAHGLLKRKNERFVWAKMWAPQGAPGPGPRRGPKRVLAQRGRPGARVARAPAPPQGPPNGGEIVTKSGPAAARRPPAGGGRECAYSMAAGGSHRRSPGSSGIPAGPRGTYRRARECPEPGPSRGLGNGATDVAATRRDRSRGRAGADRSAAGASRRPMGEARPRSRPRGATEVAPTGRGRVRSWSRPGSCFRREQSRAARRDRERSRRRERGAA